MGKDEWMNKRNIKFILLIVLITLFLIGMLIFYSSKTEEQGQNVNKITTTVMSVGNNALTVQDNNHVIYTFAIDGGDIDVGDIIELEYVGELNKNVDLQDIQVINYSSVNVTEDEDGIPDDWQDNGIFSDFYIQANEKLKEMVLEEKISQILLVRYPDSNGMIILQENQFGGYVFFERDFQNKSSKQVKSMMNSLQNVAKIPILTAVDEEGGKVVRVSSNPKLMSEPFKSSKELYLSGGFEAIKKDTVEKSGILYNLGLNVNLAPVVDVATDSSAYMYGRTLGEDTATTATYAKTVIGASKGTSVSYTLKHFPGYGNNKDTHEGEVTDERSYDEIVKNDLPPFEAGIDAGAEAVLVSHNIVNSIDSENPASLSPSVHNLLRNELGFTGIIITDDLAMGAVSNVEAATVKAVLAGNDLIITTDYAKSIDSIKTAIQNKTIDARLVDKLAFRVIAWKYYKGLMVDNQK